MASRTDARTDRSDAATAAEPVLRAIHAAGVDAAQWPPALEGLRALLGARLATLGHHEFATGAESAFLAAPADAAFGHDLARYAARNPWFLSSADFVPGRVMTGDDLISAGELRRSDFYRGVLAPRGLLHLLCGVVAHRDRGTHLLAVYRGEAEGAFTPDERSRMARLLDHVTLALESHWRWQEADELARALLALIARDAGATILSTADGEPVFRNPAADLLLERGQGLRIGGDGRLVAATAADRRVLADTIARLARGDAGDAGDAGVGGADGAGGAEPAPAVLSLACALPGPPAVVVLRAAGQVFSRALGLRRGLVMLAVRGGAAAHDPASCLLARRYALTAAQARVSALVFAGQSLATIAHTLGLSENTVRSHLKQIFQKTETHGQMELVHLHARVCPHLP